VSPPAIEVENLGKRFGAFAALEGVSLSVAEGEVFGLLGPNGAGKTTLTRILCGLLSPGSGSARVASLDVARAGAALRETVGLLTEQPGLYDRLSGWDNLRYFAGLYLVPEARAAERAEHYLRLFGIWEQRHQRAGTYSKGMRQKLAIGRALLHAPKVIFLDEPTSGLDPVAARAVRDAVAELAREGRTIVLCSHNLDEVERLCARVAVLKQRVLALAPVAELRRGRAQADVELTQDASLVAHALADCPGVARAIPTGRTLTLELDAEDAVPEAIRRLVVAGARICAVRPQARALEDVYLELVGTPGEKSA
jgi:ABC-2 type transport system ATP-binding protein